MGIGFTSHCVLVSLGVLGHQLCLRPRDQVSTGHCPFQLHVKPRALGNFFGPGELTPASTPRRRWPPATTPPRIACRRKCRGWAPIFYPNKMKNLLRICLCSPRQPTINRQNNWTESADDSLSWFSKHGNAQWDKCICIYSIYTSICNLRFINFKHMYTYAMKSFIQCLKWGSLKAFDILWFPLRAQPWPVMSFKHTWLHVVYNCSSVTTISLQWTILYWRLYSAMHVWQKCVTHLKI